jgi:transcriptional regulator
MGKAGSGELVQGTLPLLILRTLASGPNHGFAIARRIQQVSKEVLRVEEGSLYPALHRLEVQGWITSEWRVTENNRTAKYYRLTRPGRTQLEREATRWNAIAEAIAAVLREA